MIPSPNQSAMRVQWSIAMPKTRKTGIRISDRTKYIIDLAPHTHTHLNTKKYQFNPQTDFGCTQLVVLYYLHFRLVFDAATTADGGCNLFVPLKRVITFNVAPLFSLKTSTPQSSSRQNLMIIIPNRHKNITIAKWLHPPPSRRQVLIKEILANLFSLTLGLYFAINLSFSDLFLCSFLQQ